MVAVCGKTTSEQKIDLTSADFRVDFDGAAETIAAGWSDDVRVSRATILDEYVVRAALASIEQFDFNHSEGISMTKIASWLMGTVAVVAAVLTGKAISAQDKYTVQVPNGLAFSEFRGYEDWQAVAVSQTEEAIAVILANPVMIDAYRAGVPGNGRHFPDGSKIAKIHWKPKKSADAPAPTTVPDTLHDVDFIERDGKKFPDTGGWGYAQFNYDVVSDTFAPEGSGTDCGYACHTIVTAKDYIFTAYPKR